MKDTSALKWLVPLTAVLALISCGVGLFWQTGGSRSAFTTLHGQEVELYGQGIYAFDTVFTAGGTRGTDAVVLLVALPLLIAAYLLALRGSTAGRFLLASALGVFLYNSAHFALGVAYNSLFLVYVAYFSASFFSFVLAITSIDLRSIPAMFSPRLPNRGIAVFLFIAGSGPLVLWTMDILGSLAAGHVPPLLGPYTTMVTYAIDLGIITPVAYLTGVLLLRRAPLGYLLASPMLILCAVIGIVVVGQTVMQLAAGITYGPGEFVGYIGSWVVLGLFAIGLSAAFYRSLKGKVAEKKAAYRAARG